MVQEFYLGQRLSYDGSLCTVKYIGEVKGTSGSWLGVEWDDASRGKHNGTHVGVRYFKCLSKASTAASFLRPSKTFDQPIGFLDAMKRKYGSGDGHDRDVQALQIGGKEVNEVGFDIITQLQSAWSDLKVISLNGLCINGVSAEPWLPESREVARAQIASLGLKCKELDLSRNLFENWHDVVDICFAMPELQTLKLNGNRLKNLRPHPAEIDDRFAQLRELSLSNMAFNWDDVSRIYCYFASQLVSDYPFVKGLYLCIPERFPKLQILSLAFNPLEGPTTSSTLSLPTFTRLDLTSCNITTLQSLLFLSRTPNLHTLILRSNPLTSLSTTTTTPPITFPALRTLDLTFTLLPSLPSLSPIPTAFPCLSSLQTLHTPLQTSHPSSRLLTIARLPTLTTLNNTPIPARERLNAELYYQNLITNLLLSATTPAQEAQIHAEHPQWHYLCEQHGEPESIISKRRRHNDAQLPVNETSTDGTPATSSSSTTQRKENDQEGYPRMCLARHLTTFTIHTSPPLPPSTQTLTLPTLLTVYALEGLIGRLLSRPPLSLRLILETDDFDPVPASKAADNDWSCSESSSSEADDDDDREGRESARRGRERQERKKTLWARREIEIVDSVRKVADWVGGEREVKVRVEDRGMGGRREWEG